MSKGVWRKRRRQSVKQAAYYEGSRKLRRAGIQSLKVHTVNKHAVCAEGKTPGKEAACHVPLYIKTLSTRHHIC